MLRDGDSAYGPDTWLRNILNDSHRRGPRVHHSALTTKMIAPPDEPRPWSHEFSGRLLSLTTNVVEEGQAFCRNFGKPFIGVMRAKVRSLRPRIPDSNIRTDIVYTPKDQDSAHTDFVCFGADPTDHDIIKDFLQDRLVVVAEAEIPNDRELQKRFLWRFGYVGFVVSDWLANLVSRIRQRG
jgi:hypothetical protein